MVHLVKGRADRQDVGWRMEELDRQEAGMLESQMEMRGGWGVTAF